MNGIDAEKALNLLIHDLRAPLSVAQGYLRLLSQNKLEGEADRQRAITQSMEALGRIVRFCDDASSYVAEADSGNALHTSVVQVAALVNQVREACAARGYLWIFPVNPERVYAGKTGQRSKVIPRAANSAAITASSVVRSRGQAKGHGKEIKLRVPLGAQ